MPTGTAYLFPLNAGVYLESVPSTISYVSSSIGPSLYLSQFLGTITWHIINSAGVDTGGIQTWVGNTFGGFFQMAGLCNLYVPTSGNYNFNVYHQDGTIFAIEGASIVSGPGNSNPANQLVTPLAGYSFTSGGVAAANNTNLGGPGPTDSYVINFPTAGYYPMEFGWCSNNNLVDVGHITFLTGSGGTTNVIPGPGTTPGVVYLSGSVQAYIITSSSNGTYNIQAPSNTATYSIGIPVNYEWPFKKTPLFNTITRTPSSGRGELRIPLMEFPLWNFELSLTYIPGDAQGLGLGGSSYWQTLVNFLMFVQGAGVDWLFLDPYHNTATNQLIATGDGTTTEFSMLWTLVADGAQELVQNFIAAPSIYVNNVLQSPSTYNIDTFGTLGFNVAPGNGLPITWSGQFLYRCHFLDDFWQELQEDWYQVWSMKLKFRSVLL